MELIQVLKRYANTRVAALAAVLGAVGGATSTALLWLTNLALHAAGSPRLFRLGLIFAAVCLVGAGTRYLSSALLVDLGGRAARDLQVDLSRRILAAPMRRLEELGSHRLMASLTDDIMAVTEALSLIPLMFVNAAVVAGCIVAMWLLSWKLMMGVLAAMVVGISTYRAAMQAGIRRQRLARATEDDLFGHFRGVTQGTKELKTRHRRREHFLSLLWTTADTARKYRVSAMKVFLAAAGWGNLLFFVVIGLILFVPLFQVRDVMATSGFVLVLVYMMAPLQALLNSFPSLTRSTVAMRHIERLGTSLLDRAADDAPGDGSLRRGGLRLQLAGVTHSYTNHDDGSSFVLGPIDLAIEPGEIVFLVGGNGSGKTTLAKLLIGLYPPEEGEILLEGKAIGNENRAAYRELFSTVFSDFFLFESLLGLDAPDLDDKARQYLATLQLKHKVRVQDGKFSTTELSQGQRKRLALLASYLEDSPIFVFDEWAADQDPEFKRFFYYQLLPELKARGKTVLVISHDDRYYEVGDRIVKLDYGKLIYDQPVAKPPHPEAASAVPAVPAVSAVPAASAVPAVSAVPA